MDEILLSLVFLFIFCYYLDTLSAILYILIATLSRICLLQISYTELRSLRMLETLQCSYRNTQCFYKQCSLYRESPSKASRRPDPHSSRNCAFR